jgi:hypothetical protein
MLFYAQKMPKKDLFAHASQYCTVQLRSCSLKLESWTRIYTDSLTDRQELLKP